jgi:hypothetical protein
MRRTMLLGVLLAVGGVGIVTGQAPQQPNVAEIGAELKPATPAK